MATESFTRTQNEISNQMMTDKKSHASVKAPTDSHKKNGQCVRQQHTVCSGDGRAHEGRCGNFVLSAFTLMAYSVLTSMCPLYCVHAHTGHAFARSFTSCS